nr:DUF2321 domain-containing protein [uncultured Cellulosilyticum sp.]
MAYYHTAQICTNGHVITSYADQYVEDRENFCSECGASTIMHCPNCSQPIKGRESEFGYIGDYDAPSYCHYCGTPYPWTAQAIDATNELLELEDLLSRDELEYLSQNMSSIISDTPKSKVVATKLKLAMGKLSTNVASAIKDVVVDVASETAKKIILGE